MGRGVLDVSNLSAGYGSGSILQGVTLEIGAGEIVAMIGRNGVGKSTLMKAIMGVLPATSGEVAFMGQPITHLSPEQRAAMGIGYVPQGREIFPELTVEENLMMGETINRDKRGTRYDIVYAYFPVLRERRRQLAGTFSGGQQQMLAIGRALVGAPRLLLVDEPSVGIQPTIVLEIGEVLEKINAEEGLTILLGEQNTRLIARLAHRGYAMDKGRIVARLGRDQLTNQDMLVQYLAV